MIDALIYIAKLYIGLALILYLAMKLRFWVECAGWECFLRYLYQFLSILIVILFIAVKLKALDIFFIVAIFLLIVVVDYLLASKRTGTRANFFKIAVNQKIFDFLDGVINVRFKGKKLKLNFKVFFFALIFILGLLLWMRAGLQTRSLFSIKQHHNLVKITSMLMNSYGYGIEDFGVNSLSAFFSMIFGVNQYVVLHLFGAFNYMLLIVAISLLSYRLSGDFVSAMLSASFFAFVVPMLNFVSNPVEGSSFLLGLGWLFLLICFWNDVNVIWKILGLIAGFFIDVFIGFITVILAVLAEFLAKLFEGFKLSRKKTLRFIFPVFFVLLFLFGIKTYSRANPEFGIEIYALLSNTEVIAYPFNFVSVFVFLVVLTFPFEIVSWVRGGVKLFKIFYGFFLLLLLFIWAGEKSLLNFLPLEPLSPIVLISSFIWFVYILRKIFGRGKIYHDVFVMCLIILLMLNAFLHGGFKFDSSVEPDEIVQVIQKIQNESLPFSLAIVSHYGTKAMVENWAWFMDWDYFMKIYILIKDIEKIYDVVYVVVPKQSSIDKIHRSFLPRIENLEFVLDSACLNYKYGTSQIYFDGRDIKVYKLTKLKDD